MTEYLDVEDLYALIDDLHIGPVRDVGLLVAAAQRPAARLWGIDVYMTLELKAAALLDSLVRNRALVDGNKRLGWLATAVFLTINGAEPTLTQDEAYDLVIAVAAEHLDLHDIAERLDGV